MTNSRNKDLANDIPQDLLEIRDCNQGVKSILHETLSLSAQMNHLNENMPRISQDVAAVGIDVPVVAREVREIHDELPKFRKMSTVLEVR